MTDLFGQEITDEQQHKKSGQANGYSAPPGTGPEGETCGSCRFCGYRETRKRFYKCILIAKRWTNSYGTDIRLRSPACRNWQGFNFDEKLPLNEWDATD